MSVPAENHVSLLVVLLVVLVGTSLQWGALFLWWKLHRMIDETFRRLTDDRVAGTREALRQTHGSKDQEVEEHPDDSAGVEELPSDGTRVEESEYWGNWTHVPTVRPDPSTPRED